MNSIHTTAGMIEAHTAGAAQAQVRVITARQARTAKQAAFDAALPRFVHTPERAA